MGLLARTCLPAALVLGLALCPGWAEAAPSNSAACKAKRASRKKGTKRRGHRVAPKKRAHPKVTAATIAKWQKRKVPQDQIVEKATAAGYKVTKIEKKRLLRLKVKKPLIAKLEEAQKVPGALAQATPAAPSFNLEETIDPNDIDFDSVPPPKGMPAGMAQKQKEEAAKKPLAAEPAEKSEEPKTKRVVIAAGK